MDEILALVRRGGLIESQHRGHLVALAADSTVHLAHGDAATEVFARSALKPMQGVAMVRAGLRLPARLLALACASHNGEPQHLDAAREILATVGLGPEALQNTPDLPLGEAAMQRWLAAGRAPESLAQNCSGKHAAMLATCVVNDWPTQTYLDPQHPLQQLVRDTVAEFTGAQPAVATFDGCGAPLFSCSLTGLARAFGTIAAAATADPTSADGQVGSAMNTHPFQVGGADRDVSRAMAEVPGLVAKDGVEGVCALGLPDGRAAAFKIADGSGRPRPLLLAALLDLFGVESPLLSDLAKVDVLGHGRPVGRVELAAAGMRDLADSDS